MAQVSIPEFPIDTMSAPYPHTMLCSCCLLQTQGLAETGNQFAALSEPEHMPLFALSLLSNGLLRSAPKSLENMILMFWKGQWL